jgi:hypothetical protein
MRAADGCAFGFRPGSRLLAELDESLFRELQVSAATLIKFERLELHGEE